MIETKTVTFSAKELKAPDSKGQFMAFIAQTWPEDTPKSNADADGDVFVTGAFDEQNNETVPVFYQHNYAPTSEVGQAKLLPKESRTELPAQGQLKVDQGWPIADAVYESMLLPADDPAALHEFSVGYEYDTKDISKRPDGVRLIRKSRVFELSVVYRGAQKTELVSVKHQNAGPHIQSAHNALVRAGAKCIGADSLEEEGKDVTQTMLDLARQMMSELRGDNPDLTAMRQMMGRLQGMMNMMGTPKEEKSAIRPHSTGTSGAPWDGPAQVANLNNDDEASFRKAFAWFDSSGADPNGDGYPDNKGDWKFIHHFVSSSGTVGDASTVGCSSGIGVLNGGRGGANIPQSDMAGVHAHLARHMMDANMEPPPLKSYMDSIEEVRLKLAMETAGL